jgi:hypothetical protein
VGEAVGCRLWVGWYCRNEGVGVDVGGGIGDVGVVAETVDEAVDGRGSEADVRYSRLLFIYITGIPDISFTSAAINSFINSFINNSNITYTSTYIYTYTYTYTYISTVPANLQPTASPTPESPAPIPLH